jgi:hypothetical protein
LHDGKQLVSNPGRTCTILNKTFVEIVNNLIVDKILMHTQTNNNIICLEGSIFLLDTAEVDLIKTVHSMMNKRQPDLMTFLLIC